MAVYEYSLRKPVIFRKNDTFSEMRFSSDEKKKIIEYWNIFKKGKCFNSINVRLDDIIDGKQETIITISKTDFYSLLISNIIRLEKDSFFKFISEVSGDTEEYLRDKLSTYYAEIPEVHSMQQLLTAGEMANALAISILVMDRFNNVMLVKRTNNVAISKNLYSVTATGAVDMNDWRAKNPITNCAIRELREELNLLLLEQQIEFKAIVIGQKKLQPIAILDAYVDFDLNDIISARKETESFNFEIENVYIASKYEIGKIIEECNFTEAAEYHLQSIL